MTVTKFNGFIWNQKKPINYNLKKEKWPKTQDTLVICIKLIVQFLLVQEKIILKSK
jgi:hypothetical protein